MNNPMSRSTNAVATAGALEAAVTVMAKIRRCSSPSFSPDGTRLAFISDLTGLPQVWTVPVTGGWPTLVTALDDQISSVSWSPDGAWLAFALAPGGGMNTQVCLMRPDGTELRCLTDGGTETNRLGPWSHDGRTLALASNRRSPEAMDAYLVDVASGVLRLAVENRGVGEVSDVSRDGRRAVVSRMVHRGDDTLVLVDLHTREECVLTPHEGPASSSGGCFSPDGQRVYLVSNVGREMAAFTRVAIGPDGQPGPCEVLAARDDAELESFVITAEGTVAALLWNASGRSALTFFDLAASRTTGEGALPAEVVGGLTFSRDGGLLAMTAQGAAAPADIWVLDRATGRTWPVTHSPHAGVDLGSLVRPALIRFLAHDGLELSGWLYLPRAATRPGPLVLSFHGGPEGQERPSFNSCAGRLAHPRGHRAAESVCVCRRPCAQGRSQCSFWG